MTSTAERPSFWPVMRTTLLRSIWRRLLIPGACVTDAKLLRGTRAPVVDRTLILSSSSTFLRAWGLSRTVKSYFLDTSSSSRKSFIVSPAVAPRSVCDTSISGTDNVAALARSTMTRSSGMAFEKSSFISTAPGMPARISLISKLMRCSMLRSRPNSFTSMGFPVGGPHSRAL